MFRTALCLAILCCAVAPLAAQSAITFDNDDFLVLDQFVPGDNPFIFDHDLSPKGRFNRGGVAASSMAFTLDGGVVVADGRHLVLYDHTGLFQQLLGDGFTQIFPIGEIRAAPNGNYLIAAADGLGEFSATAERVRSFGTAQYSFIEMLPGGALWAARTGGVDVFDFTTGALLDTLPALGGKMSYSPSTNTVLTAGTSTMTFAGAEYDLSGSLIRTFIAPGIPNPSPGREEFLLSGLTRGPGGDVIAIESIPGNIIKYFARWQADGTWIGFTYAPLEGAIDILWAGNRVPEPASWALLAGVAGILGISRRTSRSIQRGADDWRVETC